jgi:hypothetical protein
MVFFPKGRFAFLLRKLESPRTWGVQKEHMGIICQQKNVWNLSLLTWNPDFSERFKPSARSWNVLEISVFVSEQGIPRSPLFSHIAILGEHIIIYI